ncbi:suppressor of fused domain protein [Cellulomonas sp. URHD0024]|uniref:suppressor of fused domain protein n=1 Tax=Cellulomonas sp. URHD0024 TaxID=1302620 RepID=UPI0004211022|nr:suppressor of fused domain protein [Cellulomonas sp. URHD0024]
MSDPFWRFGVELAIEQVYGETEPVRIWAFPRTQEASATAPVDTVRAYEREEPDAHWHYVGLGLSSPDLGHDGALRCELTFRLERGDEDLPPQWPADLIQHVADYVLETGHDVGPGHTFDLNAPVVPDSRSALRHLFFAPDPDLGALFVQAVGITSDELAALEQWSGFAAVLAQNVPGFVTRPSRTSTLALPGVMEAVAAGAETEGSIRAVCVVSTLQVTPSRNLADRLAGRRRITVTMTTHPIDSLRRALLGRLARGEPLMVRGPDAELLLVPEAGAGPHREQPNCWVVGLLPEQATDLADTLAPVPGTYRAPTLPHVSFDLRPSPVTGLSAPESDPAW